MAVVSSNLEQNKNLWYLAIDFGTAELSALLFNQNLGEQYPIYWSDLETNETLSTLKIAAFYHFTQKKESKTSYQKQSSFLIGQKAIIDSQNHKGIFLESLKPYLNISLSYYSSEEKQWQPKLQQSPERVLPIYWIEKATQAIFTALTPQSQKMGVEVKALGLSSQGLVEALINLQGVILSYPHGFGETYRFNLREAILGAKLVKKPQQIIFIEEAIASLLGHLSLIEHSSKEAKPTLMIELGASSTNLALVDLPDNLDYLTHQDFKLESFLYGGLSIDLDILYQFIYPQWVKNPQQPVMSLGMDFPQPGMADPLKRDTVFLRLQSSTVGRSLLEASQLVKLVLQKRSKFNSQLDQQKWGVNRQELTEKIINPYLNQINYYLNQLLVKKGQSNHEIEQIVCSGGTYSLVKESLGKLLEQKFCNAKIIDGDAIENKDKIKVSRVAVGLASLILFPKIIDKVNQQYNDYFLFIELLKILPKYMFVFEDIKKQLIERGINLKVCEKKILEFLQGKIPQGLIPSEENCLCLAEYSQNNCEYQDLLSIPFCTLDNEGYYHPEVEQCQKIRQYLGKVLASHKQQLSDPLTLELLEKSN